MNLFFVGVVVVQRVRYILYIKTCIILSYILWRAAKVLSYCVWFFGLIFLLSVACSMQSYHDEPDHLHICVYGCVLFAQFHAFIGKCAQCCCCRYCCRCYTSIGLIQTGHFTAPLYLDSLIQLDTTGPFC